jgi:hypothetical protein
MKKILILLSFVIVYSCSPKEKASESSNDSTAAKNITDSISAVTDKKPITEKIVVYYTGTIAKKLKIQATLYFFGDSVTGKYKYATQTKYLTMKGRKANNQWIIYEYDPQGIITGNFISESFDDKSIKGNWSNAAKTKTFPFVLSVIAEAESDGDALIGSKEVTLMDKNCICGKVIIPQVIGKLYPEKMEAVNKLLSFENLAESEKDGSCTCDDESERRFGLTNGSYSIHYNKNMILSIQWCGETEAAYPSGYCNHVNINLNTGQKIKIEDVVNKEGIKYLLRECSTQMKGRFYDLLNNEDEIDEDSKRWINDLSGTTEYTLESLQDFSFTDKGMTIHLPDVFPHAIQGYSPGFDIDFTYNDVRDYAAKNSVLEGIK